MLKHPLCSGCSLADSPSKFIPAIGPSNAPIAVIGEAGGKDEAKAGQPFVGAAGTILNQGLRQVFLEREALRIHNVLSCSPPNDWLVGAPWEYQSINHCSVHRNATLAEPHRVFLTVGATSSRVLLGQPKKGFVLDEWHSTVNAFGEGRWIIPTYHPAFLVHGNYNYMGVWLYALNLAREVAEKGWVPDPISTIVDPGLDDYRAWAEVFLSSGPDNWLPVDIETPEKLKGTSEDELEDISYNIVRINFAYHPDEGLTVPFQDPWHQVTRKLLASPNPKILWNAPFDIPRLRAAGFTINGKILDFMDAFKVLQSDLPRGLGFVSPLYSKHGAWKHLSGVDPGTYAAIDPAQTLRCAHGIARDLKKEGRWETFMRDCYSLDTHCLKPAEMAGVLIDKPELEKFYGTLAEKEEALRKEIQALIPEECRPLVSGTPENPSRTGWLRKPKDRGEVIEKVTVDKKTGASVTRYYVRGEFNPDSPQQVLQYLSAKGLKPGRGKKKGGDSADKLALESLAKKDPVCALILKRRGITKVQSTYVTPTLERISAPGSDGRLHTTFVHAPSTMRLASRGPNLQNVVARGDDAEIASGFRKCIIAAPGYCFVDADFAAIEAVMTGWLAQDPAYIKLAWAGVHDYMVGAELKKVPPVSELHRYSIAELKAILKPFKAYKALRDRKKKTVHGVSYGQSAHGQAKLYPHLFKTAKEAQKELDFFFSLCPSIPRLQKLCRDLAYKKHYLGGDVMPGPLGKHPFGYKHWFWNVYAWNSYRQTMGPGQDYNRAVAMGGQGMAAGVIFNALLALHNPEDPDYIGDMDSDHPVREGWQQWFVAEKWTTPFRLQVHDSALFEVREDRKERLLERVIRVMERPLQMMPCPEEWGLGPYLRVGTAVKVGRNWAEKSEDNPGGMEEVYSTTL